MKENKNIKTGLFSIVRENEINNFEKDWLLKKTIFLQNKFGKASSEDLLATMELANLELKHSVISITLFASSSSGGKFYTFFANIANSNDADMYSYNFGKFSDFSKYIKNINDVSYYKGFEKGQYSKTIMKHKIFEKIRKGYSFYSFNLVRINNPDTAKKNDNDIKDLDELFKISL